MATKGNVLGDYLRSFAARTGPPRICWSDRRRAAPGSGLATRGAGNVSGGKISSEYYLRLEQGRDQNPSRSEHPRRNRAGALQPGHQRH